MKTFLFSVKNKIHNHGENRVLSASSISLKTNTTIHIGGSSTAIRWHG